MPERYRKAESLSNAGFPSVRPTDPCEAPAETAAAVRPSVRPSVRPVLSGSWLYQVPESDSEGFCLCEFLAAGSELSPGRTEPYPEPTQGDLNGV